MRKKILALKAISLATFMLIAGCGISVYGEEASPSASSSEHSGLIILTCIPPNSDTYILGTTTYAVQCLNVDTGEITDIAEYNINVNYTDEVQYPKEDQKYFYINQRDRFSKNFDKFAITAKFLSDSSRHAGWIDKSGQFFDVIEALGLAPESDFSDPVDYFACGFAEDGSYVFARRGSGLSSEYAYYSIDPNSLDSAMINESNPYLGYDEKYDKGLDSWNRGGQHSGVTDWIDDTHCIVDVGDDHSSTMIMDIETIEKVNYLPTTSRICWDGIISPDGEKIAFLSRGSDTGTEIPSIFIVPIAGGDPVKLESSVQFTYGNPYMYSVGNGIGLVTLIDWQ